MAELLKEKKGRPILRWLGPGLLVLVLAIAAYLRLRGLAYGPILGDQSILLNIAMRWVNTGDLPLAANKSSAGIMNPPLIAYLLALPLFVERSLAAAHLFQGLMGLTAVGVLAFYAQRLFGWRVAVLAAFFFAVNPWAVTYSRFIWNPNPIPLFATLLLVSLLAYFAGDRRPAHLALVFLWLAAVTQLHLSGLVLVGVVGLVMVFFWRRQPGQSWRRALAPVAIGLLLAGLLYLPFVLFERAVGFADLRATVEALVGSSATGGEVGVGQAATNAASFLLVEELATGNGAWQALGVPAEAIGPWQLAAALARTLFVASLLYVCLGPVLGLLRRNRESGAAGGASSHGRPARRKALIILAVWLLVPILLYLRHTVYLQNYYFLYIYPAPFLAVALLLDEAISRLTGGKEKAAGLGLKSLAVPLLLLAPVLFLGLWQFNIYERWFQLVDRGQITLERQAQHVQQAIDTSRSILAENPGCDLTILAEGGTVERSSLAVIEPFVYPSPVRYVDAQRGYIIPSSCTVYLTVADNPAQAWLAENGRSRPETIQAGVEAWRFYEIPGTTESSVRSALWQNGLALVSAETEGSVAPGGQLVLRYTWQVLSPPPAGTHYHFFNHFLDGSGQIVAQDDAPAIDSLYWRAGDRLVTQFYLQLPPDLPGDRYTLLVGQYTWPDLVRVPLEGSQETTYRVSTFPAR